MRNYYALGDSRYLPHLCVLFDSMSRHFTVSYKVHVLALDQKVYDFIKSKYSSENVIVYTSSEVNEDFEIKSIRFLPPSREAISNASASGKDPGFVQYCWALSSCFGSWLMDRINEPLTYIDADIMFFSDVEGFYEEIDNKSIGVVRHRIPYLYTSGEFNVGLVYFKNDGPGRSALHRWKHMMMNPSNSYSAGFGTCGDQKYLEAIYSIYRDDTCIVDKSFGHLAPWNVSGHEYIDNKIVWEGREQDLVYFHFAHFNMTSDGYKAAYANEWIWGDPLSIHPYVNRIYDEYYQKMTSIIQEVNS